MTVLDYCLIAFNIVALCWILYKLSCIGNESNAKYIQIESKLKRIEQAFSAEFNNLKSITAKTSNKLDGVIYKLDNIKKTLSSIENQISSARIEDRRLIETVNENVISVNSQLFQGVQSIMSKLKNIANSTTTSIQLLRDSLQKIEQTNHGIDSISVCQITSQRTLIEKLDKTQKSAELGLQQVNMSLASLQDEIKVQENLLKPLESLILELTDIYASIEKTIGEIHLEEKSLSTMANKHEALIEAVKKLNQTSVDVFEILKLFILNCSLSPFEKNLTKRSR